MQHNPSFETLVALALGELDPETERRTRALLADSTDPSTTGLRDAFEQIVQVVTDMRRGELTDPPADLVHRAAALMGEASPARTRWLEGLESAVDEQLRRAGAVIARLVFDSHAQPALAGLRSASGARLMQFESDAGGVDVQVTPVRDAVETRWEIRGQFAGNAPNADVRLLDAGTGAVRGRAALDEQGTFALIAVAGQYDVRIGLEPDPLLLPQLAIG